MKNSNCFITALFLFCWFIFLIHTFFSHKNIPWGNIGVVSLVFGFLYSSLNYICQKNNTMLWLLTPLPFLLFGYIVYDFNNQFK